MNLFWTKIVTLVLLGVLPFLVGASVLPLRLDETKFAFYLSQELVGGFCLLAIMLQNVDMNSLPQSFCALEQAC